VSFTDEQRNVLRRLVDELRDSLTADLATELEGLGIDRDGAVKPESALSTDYPDHARRIETRRLLLRLLDVPEAGCKASGVRQERVETHLRGLAFTHLHRFVAFKMMESPDRKVFKQVVGDGRAMGEIRLWLASDDAPAGLAEEWDIGHPDAQDRIYLVFLRALCVRLHPELGALFDPEDLASRVFPRRWREVLTRLNDEDYEDFWGADETLGWVYQYYTPKSLRDAARKVAAPRNPWELAFRNQFYTPDYVVRFLADNTLGRLWLEMFPASVLRDVCTKLLVSPDEKLPERAAKDPRTITVLDPACGSGHFLLYCFGLFEHIYKEAWDHPEFGPALQHAFDGDRDRFRAHIPKLVVEHNLHGIDIDRRAAQIASLALWLRARKGLPEKARRHPPLIERSGIVCAEPLPGEQADYADFRQRLSATQPTAARILDRARDMLSRAGDLGSLLRVDVDLPKLVRDERRQEVEQKHGQQLSLLPDRVKPQAQWLDFSDARTNETFWQEQEAQLREHLAAYGAHAEGFEGAAQRLFAKDGAGVLRFLDAVRATYDVVLMNPPFGAPTAKGKAYLDERYPNSRQNLFACFVERAMNMVPNGFVGVLSTDAGFFRRTLEPWRRKVLLAKGSMEAMVHLGAKVLDEAKVLVAAYTIRSPNTAQREAWYLRILGKKERLARFDDAIGAIQQGRPHDEVNRVAQSSFEPLPYAAFGYWCSNHVREVFIGNDQLQSRSLMVRQGSGTANDLRFVRLRWEISASVSVSEKYSWMALAKGGDCSPFHDDVHLMVPWDSTIPSFFGFTGWQGRSSFVPASAGYYGRPGLTYPLRTKRFAPRIMPAGCAFGHKGPAVFDLGPIGPLPALMPYDERYPWTRLHEPRLLALAGLLNSNVFAHLISLGVGAASTVELSHAYEVGLLQRMPLPDGVIDDRALAQAALAAYEARREADVWDETTAAFVLPFVKPASFGVMVAERLRRAADAAVRYAKASSAIEAMALKHYGFDAAVSKEVERHVGPLQTLPVPDEKAFAQEFAKDLLSWSLGVALGRFDARLATSERPWPALAEPFAPVSLVSPGMHPPGEPYDKALVDDDGILVDDPKHADDVVAHIEVVLRRVWGDEASALVREIARALKLKGDDPLREWFGRMPNGGFWEDHRKRYAKSKREAPVYIPLRSPDGHWLAWVAYHRFTKQTLYALLGERYLLRWRRVVDDALAPIRAKVAAGTKLSTDEQESYDALRLREPDLGAFDAALRAVLAWRPAKDAAEDRNDAPERPAVEFDPQHDDGVLVCLSPLHALVPWPPKNTKSKARSRLEEVWRLVESGELDWARTAMRYFGDHVRAACAGDLSLAIAHGLDGELSQWKGWRARLAGIDESEALDGSADESDDENEDEDDA